MMDEDREAENLSSSNNETNSEHGSDCHNSVEESDEGPSSQPTGIVPMPPLTRDDTMETSDQVDHKPNEISTPHEINVIDLQADIDCLEKLDAVPNSNSIIPLRQSHISTVSTLQMLELMDEMMPMPLPEPPPNRQTQPSLPGAHREVGAGTGQLELVAPLYKGGMNVLGRPASNIRLDPAPEGSSSHDLEQPMSHDPEQPTSPDQEHSVSHGNIENLEQPTIDATVELARNPNDEGSKTMLHWKLGAVLAGVVVVVIVVVVAVVLTSGSPETEDLDTTTSQPTMAPTIPEWFLPLEAVFWDSQELQLVPIRTREALATYDATRPQTQAYEWLLNDSKWGLYSAGQLRQRLALASLYFATGGPEWFDQNNLVNWLDYDKHECEWLSMTLPCSEYVPAENPWDQHYDYQSLVLVGEPNDEFQESESLLYPQLTGSLVPELAMLTSLQVLNIQAQSLQGTIPEELSQLSSTLQTINLQSCFFTGNIPEKLYEFPQEFLLSNNPLLGPSSIPTRIGLNTHLAHLHLSETSLTGPIPTELSFSPLKEIRFSRNQLIGTLPTEIGLIFSLKILDVKQNSLHGTIPSEVGMLSKLQGLLLDQNEFTGALPTTLKSLPKLRGLETAKNLAMNWELTPEFFLFASGEPGFPNLTALRLGQTGLGGTIPSEIGLLQSLRELDLSHTEIVGQLPSELGLLRDLSLLKVTNNDLSGPIPEELCVRQTSLEIEADQSC